MPAIREENVVASSLFLPSVNITSSIGVEWSYVLFFKGRDKLECPERLA